MTIEIYFMMNARIIAILRQGDDPALRGVEQRIEELEAEVRQLQSELEGLRGCDATIALLSHQMRATCEQAGLGTNHALHDYVPLLGNEITLLKQRAEQMRDSSGERQCR